MAQHLGDEKSRRQALQKDDAASAFFWATGDLIPELIQSPRKFFPAYIALEESFIASQRLKELKHVNININTKPGFSTSGHAVHDSGEYVQNARLSGMGKDIAELVRQNPLPAVCIALGLGWLLASKTRN